MVFLGDLFQTEKGNIYKPCFVHYCPFDEENGLNKTKEQLEAEGVLVEQIPEAEQREGFYPELRVNKETKEVFYEYIKIEVQPIQMTEEQKQLKELKDKIAEQDQAILELTSLVTGGIK